MNKTNMVLTDAQNPPNTTKLIPMSKTVRF